ncbi:MAG: hypothetical protein EBU90_27975 [Proteobacteria bacterium]|nr:hypothetical protein [Pseudomonadota bacterium]
MTPFDVYKTYLALKNHFSKSNYDYFKYAGKSRASVESFNKRKDKYWFERISRQKNDNEIKEFFVANLVEADDASSVWIGNVIRDGDTCYKEWQKRQQSLKYLFTQESEKMLSEGNLNDILDASRQHPPILKMFLSGKISIETFTIYDKIFLFRNNFDKKLLDPVWELMSLKIQKYSPFIQVDIFDYKKILRNIVD